MKKIIEGAGVDPGFEIIVKNAVDTARENLEEHGELMPIALVGNSEKQSLNIVGLNFRDQKEKEMGVFMLRKFIEDMKADCVLTVLETYFLSNEDADSYDYEKDGRVSEHPNAKEGVFFGLENKFGTWSGMAEIIVEKNGSKTFGEVVLRTGDGFSGLFANLIPGKRPSLIEIRSNIGVVKSKVTWGEKT